MNMDEGDAQVVRQYLRERQRHAYSNLGRPPPGADIDINRLAAEYSESGRREFHGQFNIGVEEVVSELRKTVWDLPSEFEHPSMYANLRFISGILDRACARFGYELDYKPIFGTLPAHIVNAMAVRVPGSKIPLIIFNHGMFEFLERYCKVLACIQMIQEYKELIEIGHDIGYTVIKKKVGESDLVKYLSGLLVDYLVKRHISDVPDLLIGGSAHDVCSMFFSCSQQFLFGHEYGHIVKGHLGSKKVVRFAIGDDEMDRIFVDWREEHDADNVGANLLISGAKHLNYSVENASMGIGVFFGFASMLELSTNILQFGEEIGGGEPPSHPPALLREEVIFDRISDFAVYLGANKNRLMATKEGCANLHWGVWKKCKGAVVSIRDNSDEFAAVWHI